MAGSSVCVWGGGGGEGWGKREGDKGKWEITSPIPDTDVLWTASTAREVWCVVFVPVWKMSIRRPTFLVVQTPLRPKCLCRENPREFFLYKRVRCWTSGRSISIRNFVKYPPTEHPVVDVLLHQFKAKKYWLQCSLFTVTQTETKKTVNFLKAFNYKKLR